MSVKSTLLKLAAFVSLAGGLTNCTKDKSSDEPDVKFKTENVKSFSSNNPQSDTLIATLSPLDSTISPVDVKFVDHNNDKLPQSDEIELAILNQESADKKATITIYENNQREFTKNGGEVQHVKAVSPIASVVTSQKDIPQAEARAKTIGALGL